MSSKSLKPERSVYWPLPPPTVNILVFCFFMDVQKEFIDIIEFSWFTEFIELIWQKW
jgi:hypothetical protein